MKMSLSYYFTFSAPATVLAGELVSFAKSVEAEAKEMEFEPTLVLDAAFDTPERRDFARRVVRGIHVEDEKLKGSAVPAKAQVWDVSPSLGHCRLAPDRAVILVVTRGRDVGFGFVSFLKTLRDTNGRTLLKSPVGDRWFCRDFVNSPDPRCRKIVKRFSEAGYVESQKDEFAATI
jgi:hypothetical protein